MASTVESSLLSTLETSISTPIFCLFSDYLHPFTDLTNPKLKSKKPSKSNPQTQESQSQIRSLAKKFLPFLNRALSILPKRLSDPQKQQPLKDNEQFVIELFEILKLCLNCLEVIASQLSCKPYMVQIQRVRLLHCFEAWGRYGDAESEGFGVLERLRAIDFGVKSVKSERQEQLVPDFEKGGGDAEFGLLVVEVVATLVKSVAMRQSKDGSDYRRVLTLVEEVRPWLRVSYTIEYEKLHKVIVTYLSRSTLFLVGELMSFHGDLVRSFCESTLAEYTKSSIKDQTCKFARRICSSLFSQQEDRPSLIIDVLICVLDSISRECKIGTENSAIDFVELVAYCCNKCRAASTNFCSTVARHLNEIAGDFCQVLTPLDLILRLYATGLYFTDCNATARGGDLTTLSSLKDEPAIRKLIDDSDRLQTLSALLGSLESYFHIGCKENGVSSWIEYVDSFGQICSNMKSDYEASTTCTKRKRKDYLLSYLKALSFTCQPVAELVNSKKKQILAENEVVSVSTELCVIQDALHQFCYVSHFFLNCSFEKEGDGLEETNKTILCVHVAAFILSIKTKLNIQKSVNLIKKVIASAWIQPQGLKFLFASLYNVGVILYRNKQVEEASKALKLCCRASWTCVVLLCEIFVKESRRFHADLSEDSIVDFVTEACTKSAFLLDVLNQCANQKVKKIIVDSLENWSVAENLFRKLPGPIPLVREWVKIECSLHKNADAEDSASTLHSLLSSSTQVTKRTIGIILEQELHEYEELNPLYPKFCQKMQMKIIGILLQDVYVSRDDCLQKSMILIRKARALRACGIEGLKDCIQCLSEAICTINDMYGETCRRGVPVCNQLAVAYCLRALCTQEAEPNSKRVLQDISAAINLWKNIPIPVQCSADDQPNSMFANTMLLLYNIVDLLSLKGCMAFHHDIYKLMIRFFKWKNVPLENCVAVLWECRRLSHALCVSPINEAFIMNLVEECGELSKSIDFWINCLKGSQPLLYSFQQNFSFLLPIFPRGCHDCCSFQSNVTVGEVREAALKLISIVPLPSRSVFLSGYLYYDLGERLISNGRLIEALSCAKEALRLRTKLFQEKFSYSIEQQNETGEIIQKHKYGLSNLQVLSSVASEIWFFDTVSSDFEVCNISPWNVLQCYLESTLQVGIIHEIIGNGDEAETFSLWGKSISCSQCLPHFIVAFSSLLGKLYRKKQLWDLSEKELQSAKQILVDSSTSISCTKCRLMLEVSVDQQLGDLYRSHFDGNSGNVSTERLSYAKSLYKSSLDKLNLSEWKNSICCPKEASAESLIIRKAVAKDVEHSSGNSFPCAANQLDVMEFLSTVEGPKAKLEAKRSRKTKNALKPLQKDQCSIPEQNSRLTRSRYRSSKNQYASISDEVQTGHTKVFTNDTLNRREMPSEAKSSLVDCDGEVTCSLNRMKCWQCLPLEIMESGLVNNFILMKWEFVRRRLSLKLLTGIGKCLDNCGHIHEAHEIFLQSISVLVSRNSFRPTHPSVPFTFLLDLIGKEISGDVLAVERAEFLYNICWFSFKSYRSKDTRISCCDLSHIQLPKIVSWLMLAFVLSRDVPLLFQKVSRLLAAIYLLSASRDPFTFSSSFKELSENYWAAYFHQASLGTHLNQQFFTNMNGKHRGHHHLVSEGSHIAGSTCMGENTCNLLRLAPESIQDLEEFVTDFFSGLPSTAVVCISLLGGDYASLLQDLLLYPSDVHAWMLLSRLNSKSQPVVLLLPVDSILEETSDDDDDANFDSKRLFERKDFGKHWCCPWGSTVIDNVAPLFKLILEENYLSSSIFPLEDTKRNRLLWWTWRKKLDHCLGKLLQDIENSWLGPWRCLLLGNFSNSKRLDTIHIKLVRDLKSKCKVEVNESFLQVILGGAWHAFEREACISQLCLNKGCYISGVRCCNEGCGTSCNGLSNGVKKISGLAFQLIHEAVRELEEEDRVNRDPVILVLDFEVQMLPWENIPILRNQEVYRMPSVGSISAILDKCLCLPEQTGRIVASFPLIDPLDAFYLLNPSGDLSSTQLEFENWFRDQNLEGKAGTVPTVEELAVALKSHDLFLYFGHGSGAQYIPRHEIQKLENCAASFLMGCSSGSLTLNGCYTPQGTPLLYLLAGSPIIVSNLWEVTDKDIDRFGKAMLDAWLRERSRILDCAECDLVAEEFAAMSIKDNKGNAKRKVTRKKSAEANNSGSVKNFCDHRPKIGSFMGQARGACTLPFLTGASPVCYGVPTGIRRKDR